MRMVVSMPVVMIMVMRFFHRLHAVIQNAAIDVLKLDGRMTDAELVAQLGLQGLKNLRAG